jgi:hypothetical protein
LRRPTRWPSAENGSRVIIKIRLYTVTTNTAADGCAIVAIVPSIEVTRVPQDTAATAT